MDKYKFIPSFLPLEASQSSTWILAFIEKKLLMKKENNQLYIPELSELDQFIKDDGMLEHIGSYDGHNCYAIRLPENHELPENLEAVELREITRLTGDPWLFRLAGTAHHILHWNSVNRYCGCCGTKMMDKKDERAKICPSCGHLVYPRISPAVITAVFRGDQILLAHNRNFKEGMYSLIAGYVEPGESLEQCVEREIQEEVGIKVKNIRYFSSQPWPFPDALMMAFTAEYDSGDIAADQYEITDAAWYQADSLPDIPSEDSIAGKIIRWYRDRYITS